MMIAMDNRGLPATTEIGIGAAVARARRRQVLVSWALVAPALFYLLAAFVIPIVGVLNQAVSNGDLSTRLPRLAAGISAWQGSGVPDDTVADALIEDLRASSKAEVAMLARDLNNRVSGFRTLMISTRSAVAQDATIAGMAGLALVDARWSDSAYWTAISEAVVPYTSFYVLAALDLRKAADGGIERAPPDQRVYLAFLQRTFWICLCVTIFCIVIGYPMAYFIAQSTPFFEKLLLFLLLIPFWTSVLVRTAAWVIVLQRDGLVNELMASLHLTSQPSTLIYNRFAVYVAMTHVLLPFAVLPIYSIMKSINPTLVRAALSLGARPLATFVEVYLPLTLPGVSAGAIMVFVLGLGYYVTPALVGGPGDQMESGLIAEFALGSANWSMASAVALVLLVATVALFAIMKRVLRISNLSVG